MIEKEARWRDGERDRVYWEEITHKYNVFNKILKCLLLFNCKGFINISIENASTSWTKTNLKNKQCTFPSPEHGTQGSEVGEGARSDLTELHITDRGRSRAPCHSSRGQQRVLLHLHGLNLCPAPQLLRLHHPGVNRGTVRYGFTELLQEGHENTMAFLIQINQASSRFLEPRRLCETPGAQSLHNENDSPPYRSEYQPEGTDSPKINSIKILSKKIPFFNSSIAS